MKALIDKDGKRIAQIVDDGQEFSVAKANPGDGVDGFPKWVDCDYTITENHEYDHDTCTFSLAVPPDPSESDIAKSELDSMMSCEVCGLAVDLVNTLVSKGAIAADDLPNYPVIQKIEALKAKI
tara:strand:- start:2097 stop:2468 length:372 start_codon:yes stop_codon:yes gene_type:complete